MPLQTTRTFKANSDPRAEPRDDWNMWNGWSTDGHPDIVASDMAQKWKGEKRPVVVIAGRLGGASLGWKFVYAVAAKDMASISVAVFEFLGYMKRSQPNRDRTTVDAVWVSATRGVTRFDAAKALGIGVSDPNPDHGSYRKPNW